MNTMEVHNHNLLPGMLQKHLNKDRLLDWFHKRYSERSNTASRQIRAKLFGQGNRQLINQTTYALSLSDCYWVKGLDKKVTFEQVSPYFNDFWKGEGVYDNEAIPTLYVNGFLTKYWHDSKTLIKHVDERETICSAVGKAIGINTVEVKHFGIDKVAVTNFTNADVMFESAETSGLLDAEDFTADDILTIYNAAGFDMLFLDALVGNGDRHAGNFGSLRDANTGEYLGKSPIFDFDHAYDSNDANDFLIKEVAEYGAKQYGHRLQILITAAQSARLNSYMNVRLDSIMKHFALHKERATTGTNNRPFEMG